MAKMFYSLEEAAAKLGKSTDEVKSMADSRQLEVFRDRDRIMFKVEQVDLLSGGKGGDDIIPLAESGELEPISLASSGSGAAMASGDNPKEQTGISIFDADATEEADPSAVTRVTASPASITTGDPGKSGSGLLDLTREIDETAVGMTNLGDEYSSMGSADQSAVGEAPMEASSGGGGGGALFESPAGGETANIPAFAAMAEPYDGPGSGLVGGFALGGLITLLITSFALMLAITGMTTGDGLLKMLGDNLWAVVGGMGGFAVLCGIVGWLLGKRS